MSLTEEDIESIIEDSKREVEFCDFPLDIEIDYKYVEKEELEHDDVDGYILKIYTYVNDEKYGNEVVIPEDGDNHVCRGMVRISIDQIQEQLWNDFVVGQ